MKAAIFNPYFDTLGGGERYTMGVAGALSEAGYGVDIEWRDPGLLDQIYSRFGLKIPNVKVVESINRGDGYDVCFWLSDGSIPMLRSRNNILHFQFPFMKVNGKSLLNRMKLIRIKHVVCNSNFTKSFIDKEYGVVSDVIYPPVDVDKIKAKRKENLILYVGRFSTLMQNKRQDVLVDVFKKLVDNGLADWKLVLAGGVEVGVDNVEKLFKEEIGDYPIEIVKSPSFRELQGLYGRAKLFWSASGFGIDEATEPTKVEHFGITVVEAMAAGVVPVVYAAGGHREILNKGTNGYLWRKREELMEITKMLVQNKKELLRVSAEAKKRSKSFGYQEFKKKIYEHIN